MRRCIAYLPDGRICGESAKYVDARRGGMVCGDHEDSTVEVTLEIDRLTGVLQQRGSGELIKQVADELVTLRRKAASADTASRLLK